MPRIYCAGPLFNDPERHEMSQIADSLEQAGFETFLPHRDGLEFARLLPVLLDLGLTQARADKVLQQAIFSLDVHQLLEGCDGVVVNLNGRVPDEGTVVEASLAWLSGKALVLYKNDGRTLLEGADNPMVTGLGAFKTVSTCAEIPKALERAFQEIGDERVQRTMHRGAAIAKLRQQQGDPRALASLLAEMC